MTDTQYAGMDGTPYPPAAAATTEPVDTFDGDNALLVNCMRSLINLDAAGALVPHGIGDHARGLLSAAAVRLGAMPAPARLIPPGFALVPLRMTREMQLVVEREDWHWRDVLEAAGTVTEAQCEQAGEEPAGLPVEQEPKYTVDGAHIVNRATGEAIPHDEPVFILRARDEVAHHAIAAYASELRDREPVSHHRTAVLNRLRDFLDFATANPDRIKWPDTAPTFSEAGLSRLAAVVKGGDA